MRWVFWRAKGTARRVLPFFEDDHDRQECSAMLREVTLEASWGWLAVFSRKPAIQEQFSPWDMICASSCHQLCVVTSRISDVVYLPPMFVLQGSKVGDGPVICNIPDTGVNKCFFVPFERACF